MRRPACGEWQSAVHRGFHPSPRSRRPSSVPCPAPAARWRGCWNVFAPIARPSRCTKRRAGGRPYLLAGLYRALRRQLFVVVPTADVAERTFADLRYYLGRGRARSVALVRSRDESVGALESPSERSARMTLLADLAPAAAASSSRRSRRCASTSCRAPIFRALSFALDAGDEPGFDALQRAALPARLHAHRRGQRGRRIRGARRHPRPLRARPPAPPRASSSSATRSKACAASISHRSAATRRARAPRDRAVERDPARRRAARERVLERFDGRAPASSRRCAATSQAARDVPEAWLPLAYDERATLLDYLAPDAIVVLDEPGMLATVERGLEEERSREEQCCSPASSRASSPSRGRGRRSAAGRGRRAASDAARDCATRSRERTHARHPGAIEGDADAVAAAIARMRSCSKRDPVEHSTARSSFFSARARVDRGRRDGRGSSSPAPRAGRDVARAGIASNGAALLHLRDSGTPRSGSPDDARRRRFVDQGTIEAGFAIPGLRLRVLGDREIFGAAAQARQAARRQRRRAGHAGRLAVGDYVVHAVHGIGQYLGLRTETILGATQRLPRSAVRRHAIACWSGHADASGHQVLGAPKAQRRGFPRWAAPTGRAPKSRVSEVAREDRRRARRSSTPSASSRRGYRVRARHAVASRDRRGVPVRPDARSAKAIDAVKGRHGARAADGPAGLRRRRLRQDRSRDARRVQGDRRQEASRGARADDAARRSALPHLQRALRRLSGAHRRALALQDAQGTAGDSRAISPTARSTSSSARTACCRRTSSFADLGLIVVDEEQRFGVMHKERLKQMRASVDVLTLSATPIPRTLHMSLMGVRDLSLIQTAPKNRMSIKTVVVPASDAIVQRAITAELDRGGQVYYLHNRIESIYAVTRALEQLVPRARIAVGHGQMHEARARTGDGKLHRRRDRRARRDDDHRERHRHSQRQHDDRQRRRQIRPRAALSAARPRRPLEPSGLLLICSIRGTRRSPKRPRRGSRRFASSRISGSGLQIAMRDLEIRGAGNLLGAAQSGFIGVGRLRHLLRNCSPRRSPNGAAWQPRWTSGAKRSSTSRSSAFIPNDYIPQVSQKIAVYQQLAKARTRERGRRDRRRRARPLRRRSRRRSSDLVETHQAARDRAREAA